VEIVGGCVLAEDKNERADDGEGWMKLKNVKGHLGLLYVSDEADRKIKRKQDNDR